MQIAPSTYCAAKSPAPLVADAFWIRVRTCWSVTSPRPAPNRVWVADITYCRTFTGCVYAAFRHRRLLPPRGRLAAFT